MKARLPALLLQPYSILSAAKPSPRSLSRPRYGVQFFLHRHYGHNPADDPLFSSTVDNPPQLVKTGQKHGPGLIILSGSPIQHKLCPNPSYSFDPDHSFWFGDLAGLQVALENRADHKARRPRSKATLTPATANRSVRNTRL